MALVLFALSESLFALSQMWNLDNSSFIVWVSCSVVMSVVSSAKLMNLNKSLE